MREGSIGCLLVVVVVLKAALISTSCMEFLAVKPPAAKSPDMYQRGASRPWGVKEEEEKEEAES